jgi:hypothetical protein
VSMRRYPVAIAFSTAGATSSGVSRPKTPRPRAGILLPLFSVISGAAVISVLSCDRRTDAARHMCWAKLQAFWSR